MTVPKNWDIKERTELMNALLNHADEELNKFKPAQLQEELKEFSERYWPNKAERPPIPGRETIKNWLAKGTKSISPKYVELISTYIDEEAYEALTIRLTELERISDLQRFFGNEANTIAEVGPTIDGDWLMYRRWKEPLGRYIVSPISFAYSPAHRVITSVDTLHLRQSGAHYHDKAEKWEGVAIPQGRFVYTIHRSLDGRQSYINNLKFTVLDDLTPSTEMTSQGHYKLHMMAGFTMIGSTPMPEATRLSPYWSESKGRGNLPRTLSCGMRYQ